MRAIQSSDRESHATNEDNHSLNTYHYQQDIDEESVVRDVFEDVEVVVEAAVVESAENLHPDEGVEEECACLLFFAPTVVSEDRLACEVQD